MVVRRTQSQRRTIARAFWGGLMHHHQECHECGGSGVYDSEDAEPCYVCNGDGQLWWGSFYGSTGECEFCKRERLVSDMFEGPGAEWICLRCYLEMHRRECGCELWAAVEGAVRWPTAAVEVSCESTNSG